MERGEQHRGERAAQRSSMGGHVDGSKIKTSPTALANRTFLHLLMYSRSTLNGSPEVRVFLHGNLWEPHSRTRRGIIRKEYHSVATGTALASSHMAALSFLASRINALQRATTFWVLALTLSLSLWGGLTSACQASFHLVMFFPKFSARLSS